MDLDKIVSDLVEKRFDNELSSILGEQNGLDRLLREKVYEIAREYIEAHDAKIRKSVEEQIKKTIEKATTRISFSSSLY